MTHNKRMVRRILPVLLFALGACEDEIATEPQETFSPRDIVTSLTVAPATGGSVLRGFNYQIDDTPFVLTPAPLNFPAGSYGLFETSDLFISFVTRQRAGQQCEVSIHVRNFPRRVGIFPLTRSGALASYVSCLWNQGDVRLAAGSSGQSIDNPVLNVQQIRKDVRLDGASYVELDVITASMIFEARDGVSPTSTHRVSLLLTIPVILN